jgi:hypothetical protein
MPDMYLGSERSEYIIVLRGREVSLRDTGGEEMDMIDKKRIDFLSNCIRYTSVVFFDLTEILQQEASTKRSSYECESITCIETIHDRFEYDLPVSISGILSIGHHRIVDLSSLIDPSPSDRHTMIYLRCV